MKKADLLLLFPCVVFGGFLALAVPKPLPAPTPKTPVAQVGFASPAPPTLGKRLGKRRGRRMPYPPIFAGQANSVTAISTDVDQPNPPGNYVWTVVTYPGGAQIANGLNAINGWAVTSALSGCLKGTPYTPHTDTLTVTPPAGATAQDIQIAYFVPITNRAGFFNSYDFVCTVSAGGGGGGGNNQQNNTVPPSGIRENIRHFRIRR